MLDAATGMQLYWGNEQFGDHFRWTSIDHGVQLDDGLFVWDGPFAFAFGGGGDDLPDDVKDNMRESDADLARRTAALQLPELGLRLTARPEVWSLDDDGSFRAVLDFDAVMVLERRPQQGSEWESDDDREYHAWTQDGWDWRLRVSEEITPGELAAIRRLLAEPRPEEQ